LKDSAIKKGGRNMENEVVENVILELLQSGDEALGFICENLNESSIETCKTLSESLTELYDNIAVYVETNNITEKHRTREAALNSSGAAEKLRCAFLNNDLEKAEFILTYELIPLHYFLSNEAYFWFEVFPDREKMHKHRDMIQDDVNKFYNERESSLSADYEYDVSIMILCYNKLYLTKIALESVLKYTDFKSYSVEILLVNNGSDDNGETSAYLSSLNNPFIKTVDLKHPIGYNGYSLGPLASRGRYFIEFHSDVIATENWLNNLMTCITSDTRIGAVVAACNEASNCQQVDITYKIPFEKDDEMQLFAKDYNKSDPLKWEDRARLMPASGYIIQTMLYRLLLRDPWLYFGQFTDDDMSMFLRRSGFRQILARDTFLHHYGSQTSSMDFSTNNSIGMTRKWFYEKWGVDSWESMRWNTDILYFLMNEDLKDPKSFLFIDPRFCSTPLQLFNVIKEHGGKVGKTAAIVTDPRYYADALHIFDEIKTGDIPQSCKSLSFDYDYIVFDLDIQRYINKDFSAILKALRNLCKADTKIIFAINNPAYYVRLFDLLNVKAYENMMEPWDENHYTDLEHIYRMLLAHGFKFNVTNMQNSLEDEKNSNIIKAFKSLIVNNENESNMFIKTRLLSVYPASNP